MSALWAMALSARPLCTGSRWSIRVCSVTANEVMARTFSVPERELVDLRLGSRSDVSPRRSVPRRQAWPREACAHSLSNPRKACQAKPLHAFLGLSARNL